LIKRRRADIERKRSGGFYSKTAGKDFDDMDEGTSFWGTKCCSGALGEWMGKDQKGWTVEGGGW